MGYVPNWYELTIGEIVELTCTNGHDSVSVPDSLGDLVCLACNINYPAPRCNTCGYVPDGQVWSGTKPAWDKFDEHACR
jgi:hypothetical protein